MPIKGLTTNHEDAPLGAGLPLAARIYKGGAKTGNRPGPDLEYFRVEFQGGFDTPENRSQFAAMYGEKPKEIRGVYLIGNTPDQAMTAWWEHWGATGLHTRCDGETINRWYDEKTGRFMTTPKPCSCTDETRLCNEVGRMRFMLPEYEAKYGLSGSFMLTTHSPVDLRSVSATLYEIEARAKMVGIPFASVPWMIWRELQDFTIPKKDKPAERMSISKWMVKIAPEPSFGVRLYGAASAMLRERSLELLSAPISRQIDMTTGEIAAPEAAEQPAWLEDFIKWVKHAFAIDDPDELLPFLDCETWGDLPGDKAVLMDNLDEALHSAGSHEAAWPMVATSAIYVADKRAPYFNFNTHLPSRWYGPRQVLADLLNFPAIGSAEEGQTFGFVEPLLLGWEVRDTYVLAVLPPAQP